jgi:hypothetical protein
MTLIIYKIWMNLFMQNLSIKKLDMVFLLRKIYKNIQYWENILDIFDQKLIKQLIVGFIVVILKIMIIFI